MYGGSDTFLVCMLYLAEHTPRHRSRHLIFVLCVGYSCCMNSSSCPAWKNRTTGIIPYSNFCQFPGQLCSPAGQFCLVCSVAWPQIGMLPVVQEHTAMHVWLCLYSPIGLHVVLSIQPVACKFQGIACCKCKPLIMVHVCWMLHIMSCCLILVTYMTLVTSGTCRLSSKA